jgi:hypothetical protein
MRKRAYHAANDSAGLTDSRSFGGVQSLPGTHRSSPPRSHQGPRTRRQGRTDSLYSPGAGNPGPGALHDPLGRPQCRPANLARRRQPDEVGWAGLPLPFTGGQASSLSSTIHLCSGPALEAAKATCWQHRWTGHPEHALPDRDYILQLCGTPLSERRGGSTTETDAKRCPIARSRDSNTHRKREPF